MAASFIVLQSQQMAQGRKMPKPRVFRDRTQPLDILDDHDLIARYRLPRHCLLELINNLTQSLERPTNCSHPLSVATQVLTALRYYATGSLQKDAGDLHGISQASVSRCVSSVSNAICKLVPDHIKFPTSYEAEREVMASFHDIARFPNVLGCVDGTQIEVISPHQNENTYVCRKGFHAIPFHAMCKSSAMLSEVVECCVEMAWQHTRCLHFQNLRSEQASWKKTAAAANRLAARWQRVSSAAVPDDASSATCWYSRRKIQQSTACNTEHSRASYWCVEDAIPMPPQDWWLPPVATSNLQQNHHRLCRVAQHLHWQSPARWHRCFSSSWRWWWRACRCHRTASCTTKHRYKSSRPPHPAAIWTWQLKSKEQNYF